MAEAQRPKKLELVFEKWGRLTATLLWDEAPKTCEAIVEALPVTADCLHAQYAGSEFYFEDFPTKRDIPFENTTCRSVDYLLTNRIDGGILAFYVNPKVLSFCFVYGELVPRRTVEQEIELNIFASLDDVDEARRIGEAGRRDGPGSMTIRALDE